MDKSKITPKKLLQFKKDNRKFAALTAYDSLFASILNEAEIEVILVGDSLGMIVQGRNNTLHVTVDDVVYHTKCVSRMNKNALLVADMPFMSYQATVCDALYNAAKLIKDGNAEAVKLEGGEEIADTVSRMVRSGMPVMGHIGLTPQDVLTSGGYFVQGIDEKSAKKLINDAKALYEAGVFAMVIECVPAEVARQITTDIDVPTIGIGAGPYCDGQILVTQDMLGLFKRFKPKFVKTYSNLYEDAVTAIKKFSEEVKSGEYPGKEHSY